jgi:hypothetical protein
MTSNRALREARIHTEKIKGDVSGRIRELNACAINVDRILATVSATYEAKLNP